MCLAAGALCVVCPLQPSAALLTVARTPPVITCLTSRVWLHLGAAAISSALTACHSSHYAACLQLSEAGATLTIDESSLTGESLPVTRKSGDALLSGAVITRGEAAATVTATGKDSFFGKTLTLLGTDDKPGHMQKVRLALARAMRTGQAKAATHLSLPLQLVAYLLLRCPAVPALRVQLACFCLSPPVRLQCFSSDKPLPRRCWGACRWASPFSQSRFWPASFWWCT